MELTGNRNLANLFSLYNWIGRHFNESSLHERREYSILKTNNSAWPNITYNLVPTAINDTVLEAIIQDAGVLNTTPLIILEDTSSDSTSFRKNGFLLADRWLGMEMTLATGGRDEDEKYPLELSIVETEQELTEWTNLVSQVLFNGKPLCERLFRQLNSKKKADLIIAKNKDRIVGTTMIYYDEENVGGIYMVCVSKEEQGKGIGRTVMNFTLQQTQQKKIETCVLQATRKAISLYENLGFKKTEYYNLYLKVK